MSFITIGSNSCCAEEVYFYLDGPLKGKVSVSSDVVKEAVFEKSEKTKMRKTGKAVLKALTYITSLAMLSIFFVNKYASEGSFGEALGKFFISVKAFCADKSNEFSKSLNNFKDCVTNKVPWLNLLKNKIIDYYSLTKNNFKINFEKFITTVNE